LGGVGSGTGRDVDMSRDVDISVVGRSVGRWSVSLTRSMRCGRWSVRSVVVVVVVNLCGFVRSSGLWYDFTRWRWSLSRLESVMREFAVLVDTDDEPIIVSAQSEADAIRSVSDDCESRGFGALDVGAVGLVQVWQVR